MERNFLTDLFKYVVGLSKPDVVEIDGLPYSDRPELNRIKPPVATGLTVSTLTAVIDYIKANIDNITGAGTKIFIHIKDFNVVKIYGYLDSQHKVRDCYLGAVYSGDNVDLSEWQPTDKFIPQLQSLFMDGGDKENLLKVLGNLSSDATISFMDDGVTTETQAKVGIDRRADVTLPATVTLTPFSTFPEIEQPQRKYTFRLQRSNEKIMARIIPADGETWKNAAMKSIYDYIKEQAPACESILY